MQRPVSLCCPVKCVNGINLVSGLRTSHWIHATAGLGLERSEEAHLTSSEMPGEMVWQQPWGSSLAGQQSYGDSQVEGRDLGVQRKVENLVPALAAREQVAGRGTNPSPRQFAAERWVLGL